MRVAFLDRDGVINRDAGYIYKTDEFELTSGCIQALQILQRKGYELIIVTNQSGIARGYYSEEDYQKLTSWYRQLLADHGVFIKDVLHCPHGPDDGCPCRKPACGLFVKAAEKYTIDFDQSLVVGDKLSDIEAAKKMDIHQCYLLSTDSLNDFTEEYKVVGSLLECAKQLK
ncbi:D,D-heptose 1,7-bisphosphate phosphatase [Candidatus Endobugula sertula]|uniref:D,D-heptose 1,7-bisphosphate phosphatase n=1 Tax=Candidatus Endobugula sertula TaxID=62101 RepID=A0A1D2QSI9_9GAMM|nr:D,D-heptose 1,7-bisphosphate phosphatase [Candidatus Endobugula sertula]